MREIEDAVQSESSQVHESAWRVPDGTRAWTDTWESADGSCRPTSPAAVGAARDRPIRPVTANGSATRDSWWTATTRGARRRAGRRRTRRSCSAAEVAGVRPPARRSTTTRTTARRGCGTGWRGDGDEEDGERAEEDASRNGERSPQLPRIISASSALGSPPTHPLTSLFSRLLYRVYHNIGPASRGWFLLRRAQSRLTPRMSRRRSRITSARAEGEQALCKLSVDGNDDKQTAGARSSFQLERALFKQSSPSRSALAEYFSHRSPTNLGKEVNGWLGQFHRGDNRRQIGICLLWRVPRIMIHLAYLI